MSDLLIEGGPALINTSCAIHIYRQVFRVLEFVSPCFSAVFWCKEVLIRPQRMI